jgi:hypothetical protein
MCLRRAPVPYHVAACAAAVLRDWSPWPRYYVNTGPLAACAALPSPAMNQRHHRCGTGCGGYSLAEMQDLRDQYREQMEAKARRACEVFAAIGCAVVSVDRDGRVYRYDTITRS